MTPILLPVAKAIGMHPVHFGVLMIANLCIGFITPPVGMNLFVVSSLVNKDAMLIAKKAIPLLIVVFIALILVSYIPSISMLLLN